MALVVCWTSAIPLKTGSDIDPNVKAGRNGEDVNVSTRREPYIYPTPRVTTTFENLMNTPRNQKETSRTNHPSLVKIGSLLP